MFKLFFCFANLTVILCHFAVFTNLTEMLCHFAILPTAVLVFVFVNITLCPYEEERAGCLALIAFWMSGYCKCSAFLPHGAMGWYAVGGCCIYRSYSLTFDQNFTPFC